MVSGIITFLLIICIYTAVQVISKIIRQQKHLDDETLKKVVKTTIKYENNYDDVIAHLGICEKCQDRLHEISKEI